jgi:1,4-alpha-glucan branching enzyme
MKKSESLEQNRIRQTRARGATPEAARTAATAKAVKLSPTRKGAVAGLLPEHRQKSETHAVRFEYFNPNAREVLVAGTFNDWQAQATPMNNQRGGKWFTEVLLKPGQYEYRLVVDGQWVDDPRAERFVANPFGGLNGIIEVKPMTASPGGRP